MFYYCHLDRCIAVELTCTNPSKNGCWPLYYCFIKKKKTVTIKTGKNKCFFLLQLVWVTTRLCNMI